MKTKYPLFQMLDSGVTEIKRRLLRRKASAGGPCAQCLQAVLFDLDSLEQICGCGVFEAPQWVKVDSYSRKQYLKHIREIYEAIPQIEQ